MVSACWSLRSSTVFHDIFLVRQTLRSYKDTQTFISISVDGYFTTWSTWTTCTATCAGGTNSRNRTCIPPQYSGADCVGEPEEISACNTQNCPSELHAAKFNLTLKAPNKNCSRRHFNVLLLSFEENKA